MTRIVWDQTGERYYETGVDHGVLYLRNQEGEYTGGVPWNGLTSVTESPTGAEANPQYADNIKYLNLTSAEELEGTIEAFTYPEEFAECDGSINPAPGVTIGQQNRKSFGMSYRTVVGNDVEGTEHGYKIHLIYGAMAAPSEKAYETINDSPEAITFSWEFTTNPVEITGVEIEGQTLRPTASLTIDSREVDAVKMQEIEAILYGSDSAEGAEPSLPLPGEVVSILQSAV